MQLHNFNVVCDFFTLFFVGEKRYSCFNYNSLNHMFFMPRSMSISYAHRYLK